MGLTITEKIISAHSPIKGAEIRKAPEIALKIDQTLTQDATGTMAYLELEKIGIDRVKTELSLSYVDHNTLQSGFENADDHRYLRSVAKKYGVVFSKAGNGICHRLHLEYFGVPGKTLLGSDSHTPTAGGIGMLAIGAGGMDVAVAMGGGEYFVAVKKIIKVNVTGKLRPFVSAKDVSLELLRQIGAKGGVGAIIEWGGEGIKNLSVSERATIANMGAETGATSTVFPADEITKAFLTEQGREKDFTPLFADEDAVYDEVINIDMSALSPLIACPHSPDNVVTVASLEAQNIPVDQVCVGSCTNSSLKDLLTVAELAYGKKINPRVSMSVSPGSSSVLRALCGQPMESLLGFGVRLLECACGPCIGMGFSPSSNGVSVRTFNRNFLGRSGTKDASVYLASPETAVAAAITGKITDPTKLFSGEKVPSFAQKTYVDRDMFEYPPLSGQGVEIERGPNIKECPEGKAPTDNLPVRVSIKVGDGITTDHIIPAGSKVLPYRSNVPKLSQFCFSVLDKDFHARATEMGESIIVGGENYGQGSSREHAALTLLHLGIRAVVAKSFARIHAANLINSAIVPLTFKNPDDYDLLTEGDECVIENLASGLDGGKIYLNANGKRIELNCCFTPRAQKIILSGGLLKYTGEKNNG